MLSISVAVVTWLVCLKTFSAALDPGLDKDWEDWMSTHGKVYAKGEEAFRRATWEENLRRIKQHNYEASLGMHTYTMGMNHFGDLTEEEFNQRLNCFRPDLAEQDGGNDTLFQETSNLEIPRHVDWRTKGYVTRVKDQGTSCRSCWAFSATGALEGLHFKKTGRLVSLSEQNLIDCSWGQGNKGCGGGSRNQAFKYVSLNKGIASEQTYRYEARNGRCRYNPRQRAATCTSTVRIAKNNERALEQAVATVGPVSVAVDSRHMKQYTGGIYYNKGCRGSLNHAMLVVGYGFTREHQKIKNYWILKNSWSERWGEKGYMRLAKGVNNQCGVASDASFPVL
ncbi:procathepsin L-like [Elgaria multicarinata webbii]|uniref:procathepsin L-like n=1 Tax=Elgaria multicarinata webbii TaxID=159646 RepID=UPI002FCD2108